MFFDEFCFPSKGQLISKRNSQAEDSPKKRTNEFIFTSMRRVFVRFLGESLARKKSFRDYLTFSGRKKLAFRDLRVKYIVVFSCKSPKALLYQFANKNWFPNGIGCKLLAGRIDT